MNRILSSVGPADPVLYMVSAAAAEHGGTFNATTGKRAVLTDGYLVGMGREGDQPALVIPLSQSRSPESVAEVRKVRDLAYFTGLYVGAWEHEGHMFWETSVYTLSKEAALYLAESRGEHSIWDVRNSREIVVGV